MDPDDDGHATYEPFLAICALKLHGRAGDGPDAAEVDEAFRLFAGAGVAVVVPRPTRTCSRSRISSASP